MMPLHVTAKIWITEFKRDRQSLEDDLSPRSVIAATPEMVNIFFY